MRLRGRRALVTGAGRGVGVAIGRALAREGASVALAYRSSRAGAQALADEIRAGGGKAYLFQGDLCDPAQAERVVSEAIETLGGLEILINNAAGFGPLAPLAEASWEQIDTEWRAVVAPVVNVTRAAIAAGFAAEGGCIVHLAATLLQRPAPGQGAHAMAKAAVLAHARTLARELGPRGTRVNVVSPGMALTEFSLSLPEEERAALAARTPLRRLATPDDVADAVLLLCLPEAEFITGANIAPDGGLAVL